MDIYVDGSCLGNPGPGAWAFYVPEMPFHKVGGSVHTTNNYMELKAIEEALKWVIESELFGQPVCIFGDSQWAISVITGKWRANFHTGMIAAIRAYRTEITTRGNGVRFQWVRGHSGTKHNETVDALAHQEATRIRRVSNEG